MWVVGNVIHSRSGFVGMKWKEATPDVIQKGKNIGRANETSPETQAIAEARSKHQKKRDKGFVYSMEEAEAGKVTEDVGGGYFPMLAKSYDDSKAKIKFPAYVQPKLDGLRAPMEKGKFFSRSRKPFPAVVHLEKEAKVLGFNLIDMDGELYNHDYKDNFEDLVSAIKRNKAEHPLIRKIQYHVYDLPLQAENFAQRVEKLRQMKSVFKNSSLFHLVETHLVRDEDELMERYAQFVKQGYEGLMVRNMDGGYEFDKRSYNLQKVKTMMDDEFEIVGIEEGRGALQGHIGKFICKMDDQYGERTFEVLLSGDNIREFLKRGLKDHSLWEGKWMRVQYQGLTNAEHKPRFPVGLGFREAE